MSLERDRQALADLRRVAVSVPLDEYRRQVASAAGVAFLDQFDAATRDSRHALAVAGGALGFHEGTAHGHELGVMLMAGVLRCVAGHSCEHAKTVGIRPLFAALSARVISCDSCLPRFRGPLAAARRRIVSGADTICDFCLEEPQEDWYRDVVVQYGPALVGGSMCADCWERHKPGGDGEEQ